MGTQKVVLEVLLVITSILLIISILLHKGKGGGMSDMFGGGISTTMRSSGVANRNLNIITVVIAILWIVSVVGLGLIMKQEYKNSQTPPNQDQIIQDLQSSVDSGVQISPNTQETQSQSTDEKTPESTQGNK